VVGSNGAYSIMNLADDWYYPLSVLDSNGDGEIDPSYGDAIGAYGVVLGVDMEPDSVHIVGGNSVTGINFSLFDPMVIVGYLTYNGIKVTVGDYYIGVFRTAGFDPQNIPDPDYGTMGFWPPFDYEYKVDEFEDGLAPGTYYVGAYLDFDLNGMYDPGVDPAGFYGGIQSLIPITLGAGEDAFNINITIEDPAAASSAGGSVSWSSTQAPSQTRDVARRIREVLEKAR
jgi:hypothetical protein